MLLRTKKDVGVEIPEKKIVIRKVKPSEFEPDSEGSCKRFDFDPGEFDERFDECGEIISMDFQCESKDCCACVKLV